MSDVKNVDIEVQKLKSEATRLLNAMFEIPEGYSSWMTTRIVECIVSAAILEVASLNQKALPHLKI